MERNNNNDKKRKGMKEAEINKEREIDERIR
jgi:hypothetical protein